MSPTRCLCATEQFIESQWPINDLNDQNLQNLQTLPFQSHKITRYINTKLSKIPKNPKKIHVSNILSAEFSSHSNYTQPHPATFCHYSCIDHPEQTYMMILTLALCMKFHSHNVTDRLTWLRLYVHLHTQWDLCNLKTPVLGI